MYRLVRRIKAGIKIHEFAILSAALALALVFGAGAGKWYVNAGRDSRLIASVNTAGGLNSLEPSYADAKQDADENAAASQYADSLLSVREDAGTSGFFTSPRAGLLQSANGYSASYLAIEDDTPTDNQGEQSGAAGEQSSAAGEQSGAAGEQSRAAGEQSRAAGEPSGAAGEQSETAEEPSGTAGEQSRATGEQSGAAGEQSRATGEQSRATGEQSGAAAPDQPLYTVKVIYNGERYVFQTVSKKVSDLFDEKGIALTDNDKVSGAYLDGIIDSDLYIEIKRITQKTVVEDVKIPAKTVYRYNAEIAGGKSKTVRSASDGLKRVEYVLSYENGIQIGKKAVKEEIITEAVSGIVEQGSSGVRKGKNGVEFAYKQVIDVKCTAYNLSYKSTGKRPGDPAYGVTKSGMLAREGVVAVDPSVIPLGTKMYIEILDDSIEDYGMAIAGDTGGKIKGKKVDLFFDASEEALKQFGVRKAKVYIIE